MSSLSIKVEGSPGFDRKETIVEMCRLASRMRVMVRTELNGVHVTAIPFCDAQKLGDDWYEAMISNEKYRYVCGQPWADANRSANI